MAQPDYETHDYDVIVIGAGGAGLRATIEAKERGLRTAVICKSLLGKAHTVMAEGGMAASMGNVWEEDNWQVHFRDTMRGGKMLNNWRMAQIHAQEAPDRVYELERWGALFDRTARRAHLPARLRRPPLRPPGPRGRPHRARADPHPPAEGRLHGHRRVHGVQDPPAAHRRRGPRLGRGGLHAGHRRDARLHRQGGGAGDGLHRQGLDVHLQLVGVRRRRPRHGDLGRRGRDRHGVRPVPPDRDGLATLGARHPRHRGRARRRRRAAQLRGHPLHVQLRGTDVPGRDGGDRRGSRRLVRRPHQQPPHARPVARATRWPAPSTPR